MNIQTAAFIAGIVFGSVAVGSASYIWVRHREFGFGGGVLSGCGVILLGLSIWSGVKFEVSEKGLKLELDRLAQQVNTVVEANQAVTQEVKKIAEVTQTGRQQFLELTKVLEAGPTIAHSRLEEIREPMLTAPVVDQQRLDSIMDTLKQIGEAPLVQQPKYSSS